MYCPIWLLFYFRVFLLSSFFSYLSHDTRSFTTNTFYFPFTYTLTRWCVLTFRIFVRSETPLWTHSRRHWIISEIHWCLIYFAFVRKWGVFGQFYPRNIQQIILIINFEWKVSHKSLDCPPKLSVRTTENKLCWFYLLTLKTNVVQSPKIWSKNIFFIFYDFN